MGTVLKAKSKGQGTTVSYPVTRDQAYDVCMAIFRWEGSDAIEEHKSQGYMLTSWSSGMGNGTVAGAFIESADPGNTRVTAITQRRQSLSVTTDLTETHFHTLFARSVELLKAGKTLPLTAPK